MSSLGRDKEKAIIEPEVLMTKEVEWSNWELGERDIRQGIDLATTLERIEKNFVISDPRLPDCPIVRLINVLLNYFFPNNLSYLSMKMIIDFLRSILYHLFFT